MHFIKPNLSIKTGLLLFLIIIPGITYGQCHKGAVFCKDTHSAIGFVNIGIIGKNVGTVSDESGNFTLALDNANNDDSLRFSMIGYEPKCFLVSKFKENLIKEVFLNPTSYNLHEVKVTYHKNREVKIGTEVTSNLLRSGFSDNALGSELGIKVETRGKVRLDDINLNVATCTFDSVTYRLNIYQSASEDEDDDSTYKNILTQPIYITFSKDMIDRVIKVDLKKYSIIVEGNILVTLELFRDMGDGRLLFHTEFFKGTTYHRKAIEGKWAGSPGVIGMYLHGKKLKSEPRHSKNAILAADIKQLP